MSQWSTHMSSLMLEVLTTNLQVPYKLRICILTFHMMKHHYTINQV
uniref:Uncharacterized protein n=1 Tax=Anguilla anguilla TaxID=7936 RepID=A0A0E9XCB5_ANGAN